MDEHAACMRILDVVRGAGIPFVEKLLIFDDQGNRLGISRVPSGATFFAHQHPGKVIWRMHPTTGIRVVGVRYTQEGGYEVIEPETS